MSYATVTTSPTLSTMSPGSSARLPGVMRRFGRESAYLLLGFPLALAAFIVVITGLSVGAGLAVTLVGFPILALTLLAARGFAETERLQLHSWLGIDAPRARYRSMGDERGWFRKAFVPLRDPQSWLDALHAIVGFVTATVGWSFAVAWWAGAAGGLTFPAWGWALPNGPESEDLPELLGLGDSYAVKVVFHLATGVFFLVTLPFVVRVFTLLRTGLAQLLLLGRAASQQQVDELVVGRTAARSAEASALRRLERDIHDGPQQRLVRLSMDLGRARKQAGDDNPQLQGTLDAALAQTKDTLEELRALSRGIAPPVLADRGLRAAIEELAARSVVPIDIDVDLPDGRLPHHVETTVYFVVSEALTNVAKHSGATQCVVTVALVGQDVGVRVSDDGHGGAHLSKGRGLLGLQDRVRAADGVLQVTSPEGGPTIIEAEVPCAS